jgi:hypothetical protein
MATTMYAGQDADLYVLFGPEVRERIARWWSSVIYYCPVCDDAGRRPGDGIICDRYSAYHDETGYMGTGTTYPPDTRRLAGMIASN